MLVICTSAHVTNLYREYLAALLQNYILAISIMGFSINVQHDIDACHTLIELVNKYCCYFDFLRNSDWVMWCTKLFLLGSVIYFARYWLMPYLQVALLFLLSLLLFDSYLQLYTFAAAISVISTNFFTFIAIIMMRVATDSDGTKVGLE